MKKLFTALTIAIVLTFSTAVNAAVTWQVRDAIRGYYVILHNDSSDWLYCRFSTNDGGYSEFGLGPWAYSNPLWVASKRASFRYDCR